jgi:ribulose-bisphosphate carboxylase large chain
MMQAQRIRATYFLRTAGDPQNVAAAIAGEQSSGTFIALPGESAALLDRSAARVDSLEEVADSGQPPLPGDTIGFGYGTDDIRSFCLVLSWPMASIGPSLPNLVATIAGNLFELAEVAGLKLLDFELPTIFVASQPGPAFGISGTRRLSGVSDGPLIGTIIKPSVGLSPEETAELVSDLVTGGIDFIKDDELQSDGPACPFEDRIRAVMSVIRSHADRTGRQVMYAANVTGDLDEMRRRHDFLLKEGGTCAMLSLNSVGLAGVLGLRKHSQMPIHAHRNGWGYLGRNANNGWSYVAWSKLWRLAGVDHMHVNGLSNKFWEPDESVVASALSLLMPLQSEYPMRVMPVFASGQTIRQVHNTWSRIETTDLIYCAGGGIMGHPAGPSGGVKALRTAWDAARAGIPLDKAATQSSLLQQAMETFK